MIDVKTVFKKVLKPEFPLGIISSIADDKMGTEFLIG